MQENKYWSLTTEKTAELLETNVEKGLSATQAKERLLKYGKNILESKGRAPRLKVLLNQLKSPLIIVLIFAGILTIAISHYQDAIFIFIAVIVNSILGFYQENKAEQALSELKSYLKQRTRVIRDGREMEIDSDDITIGDIIHLTQGDRVPADSRVVFSNDLQVDESILTGESMPVTKTREPSPESASLTDQGSMIFAGTLVTQGVCSAIVCRTDAKTELGKIAALIAITQNEKTPLQKAITEFSITLSLILGVLTIGVFIIGMLAKYSAVEMFLTSIAIAVSAIPEGLPISMTVILAIGVERMAKRKGVVRKLVAAEALGSTTVILTDKTGTLTMAKMALSKIIPFGLSQDELINRALTNTDVLVENPEDDPENWIMTGRIMEKALVQSAGIRKIPYSTIINKEKVLQTLPFNAVNKYSVSLVKEGDDHVLVFYGAPDILLRHSTLDKEKQEEMQKTIDLLAENGERVLGVATNKIQRTENYSIAKDHSLEGLSFDGLITFRDPIRPNIGRAIERIGNAGIRTIIMTGDHRGTAVSVAKEIGMRISDESVLDAGEIALLSDQSIKERLVNIKVISRVTPFDKLRIAKLLQESGEIVAMTGDGVNDAPSIRQADIGIAMGSGTEVARSVADLVLLDDNYETIVSAIEEGRQIMGNIKKVLVYLLSNVTDGLILIGGSLLTGMPLPLNALQILWVNFFSDSFPAIAFAFETESDVLSGRPRQGKMKLFDPLMKFLILVIGISTSAMLFGLYYALTKIGYDLDLVKTFIFAAFGTYTLILAFSVKSLEKSIFSYSIFSNKYLLAGTTIGLILMACAIYVPFLQSLFGTVNLPFIWVIGVFVVGMVNILLIEIAKFFFRYGSARREKNRIKQA